MSTGDPIYLVSACSSGEEFVAAFRRYADRNGLFIPMADPIPVGRRGHFALTLKDGGVMVSGDAEIISSAKTPSVLHGRVGMTLRFADLDADSKTVLVELEKARLSMRPPPPSVPPRPATIPEGPRPQLPSIGGRIDAMNALAECVAIGNIEAMVVVEKAPPKAGPKFVMPSIPGAGAARTKTTSAPPPMPAVPPSPADRSEKVEKVDRSEKVDKVETVEKVDKATEKAASERTGPRAPIPSTIPPPRAPVDTVPDAKAAPKPAFRGADTDPDAPKPGFRGADTDPDAPKPAFRAADTDPDAAKPAFRAADTVSEGVSPPFRHADTDPDSLFASGAKPGFRHADTAPDAMFKQAPRDTAPDALFAEAKRPEARTPAEPIALPRTASKDAKAAVAALVKDVAARKTPAAGVPRAPAPAQPQSAGPAIDNAIQRPVAPPPNRARPVEVRGPTAQGSAELRRPEERSTALPPVVPARDSEQTGVASPPDARVVRDSEQTGVVTPPAGLTDEGAAEGAATGGRRVAPPTVRSEGSGARPMVREADDDEQTGVVAVPDKPPAAAAKALASEPDDDERTGVRAPPIAPEAVPSETPVPQAENEIEALGRRPTGVVKPDAIEGTGRRPALDAPGRRPARDSEQTGVVKPDAIEGAGRKPALDAPGRRPARDSEQTGVVKAGDRPQARLAIAMMAQPPDDPADAPPDHEVLVAGPTSPTTTAPSAPAVPKKPSQTAVALAATQVATAVEAAKTEAIPAATADEGSGPMLDPLHDPVSGKRLEGPPRAKPTREDPTVPMSRDRIESALAGNGLEPQLGPGIIVPSSRRSESVIELELGDAGVSLVDDNTDIEVPDLALGAAGATPVPPRKHGPVEDVPLGSPGRKPSLRMPAATPPPVPVESLRARQSTPVAGAARVVDKPSARPATPEDARSTPEVASPSEARQRGAVPLVDEPPAPASGRLQTEHGIGAVRRTPSAPLRAEEVRAPRPATPAAPLRAEEVRAPRQATPSAPLPIQRKPADIASVSDVEIDEPTDLTDIPIAPEPARASEAGTREPRRTVIGIPVSQSGEHMVPAQALGDARSTLVMSQQEPSSGIVGPASVDAHAATIPPSDAGFTPDDDPIAPPPPPTRVAARSTPPPVAAVAPPVRNTPAPVAATLPMPEPPAVAPAGEPKVERRPSLPTGDWTISLDESAPDGWSEPSRPDARAPDLAEVDKPRLKMIQASTVMAAAATNTPVLGARKPNENERRRGWSSGPTLERNEPLERPAPRDVIADEPKVQIDPTLIEPLQPMPAEEEPVASGSAPAMAVGTAPADQLPLPMAPPAMVPPEQLAPIPTIAPPPIGQPMMPGPVPGSYVTPVAGYPVPPQQPGYAMDPNAQMQMMGFPPPQQRMVTDGGVGFFHDDQREVRYPSEQVIAYDRHRRRRIFVIAASAALVVLLGVILLVVLSGGGGKSDDDKPKDPEGSSSGGEPKKQSVATTTPDAEPSPADPPATAPDAPPAEPTPQCFADLSSVPASAEVRRGKELVGATPFKMPLPCGEKVTLTFTKKGYPSVEREVLPKEEAPKINVVFQKPSFVVRVTSSPTGAAVTMNGKAAGVTPGALTVNGFEATTFTFTKAGYSPVTLTITPKANNTPVNAVLTKLPPRRR